MGKVNKLNLHSSHLQWRASSRNIDKELFSYFSISDWELMTVEIRTDTGKFVNSSWRKIHNDTYLWIVIGFNNTVMTAMYTNKLGEGDQIITDGHLFNFVDQVNTDLNESIEKD